MQAKVLQPQDERFKDKSQHQVDNFTAGEIKWFTMAETLFEKIISRQIPAKIAYEDDKYIAIHDIGPQAPVHILIIPKKVIPTLNDVEEGDRELIGGLFLIAKRLMSELGHTDYRTVFNCGPGAQQSVFHLHLHVLAGRPFTWPPG